MSDRSADAERAKGMAEARFEKRREQERAAQSARAAEEARAAGERDKTARLRALRLAKEEADRVLAAAAPPVKATRKSSTSRKAPA